MKLNDIQPGSVFGKLTVIQEAPKRGDFRMFNTKCQCGNTKEVRGYSLITGNTKGCGCVNGHVVGDRLADPNEAAFNQLMSKYKGRARDYDREFQLTEEQFHSLTQQPCHYCGIQPSNVNKVSRGSYTYSSLDRVNNNRGYSIDNVVPCCRKCNTAKRNRTIEEFRVQCLKNNTRTLWLTETKPMVFEGLTPKSIKVTTTEIQF